MLLNESHRHSRQRSFPAMQAAPQLPSLKRRLSINGHYRGQPLGRIPVPIPVPPRGEFAGFVCATKRAQALAQFKCALIREPRLPLLSRRRIRPLRDGGESVLGVIVRLGGIQL